MASYLAMNYIFMYVSIITFQHLFPAIQFESKEEYCNCPLKPEIIKMHHGCGCNFYVACEKYNQMTREKHFRKDAQKIT